MPTETASLNNRRSFIRQLLTACVAPSVLIPLAKNHHKWKRDITTGLYHRINPAWSNATYEVAFLVNPGLAAWSKLLHRTKWEPGMGDVMRPIQSISKELAAKRLTVKSLSLDGNMFTVSSNT